MEDDSRSLTPHAALRAFFAATPSKTAIFLALSFFGLPLLRMALPTLAGSYFALPSTVELGGEVNGLFLLFWPFVVPFRFLDTVVPEVGPGAIRAAAVVGAAFTCAYFYVLSCLFVVTEPATVLAEGGARVPDFVRRTIGDRSPDRSRARKRTR